MPDILTNLIQDKKLDSYPFFKEFCLFKEKGLRKDAFKSLNLFIEEVKGWQAKQKKEFAHWLFKWFEESEDIHYLLVHPLEENILKPILEDWMIEDPKDPQPFRWYGLFLKSENHLKHLETALRVGGKSEQRVLMEIINYYLYSLEFSFHHISEDAYIGDISEDQDFVLKIENLSTEITNVESKKDVSESVIYYKNLLSDWIAFSSKGKKGFLKWCSDNGKEYEWTNSYYYE
ncbi:hypothetical protein [Neobacillus massiliamazoniensis]|uniref:Uncharacterized protein n=1 Tax=Neobacillus massiliamazoniensis TaxID=1499688 RepID=A0A0U1P3C4_9BACI|nr:hypothetical protein [Neobacillus massiliamazoniensis]CRK84736.1 hypothetical protein BN000_04785 [Neobacillus massiliamazoniensis]